MYNENCIWQKCEKWSPWPVAKLFSFNNTATVIEYYQRETVNILKYQSAP